MGRVRDHHRLAHEDVVLVLDRGPAGLQPLGGPPGLFSSSSDDSTGSEGEVFLQATYYPTLLSISITGNF